MLKPRKMEKATILGRRKWLRKTVETLYRVRSVHVIEYQEGSDHFRRGKPLEDSSLLSKKLMEIRKVNGILGIDESSGKEPVPVEKIETFLKEKFPPLLEKVSSLQKNISEMESHMSKLQDDLDFVESFRGLPKDVKFKYSLGEVIAGKIAPEDRKRVENKIVEVISVSSGEYAFFIVPQKVRKETHEALSLVPFDQKELPKSEKTLGEYIKNLEKNLAEAEKSIASLEEQREELAIKYQPILPSAEEHLDIECEKAEMPVKFAVTDNFFFVDVWYPLDKKKKLHDAISAIPQVDMETSPTEQEEASPVAFDNPKPIKGYQILVGAFARPKVTEIDPTLFISLTFPLFFGFMLGDIGYALVMLLFVFTGVYSWLFEFIGMGGAKKALNQVLLYSAFSTLIFGVIYGEFFGVEIFGHHGIFHSIDYGWKSVELHWLYDVELSLPLHRMHDTTAMIAISLIIGVAHLLLSWGLGFRNELVEHGFKHALFSKGSWILILTGGVLWSYIVVGTIIVGEPFSFGVLEGIATILFTVGAVLAVVGEGVQSLIEIPMYVLSNSLSYTRLFAVGLSSAGIALAVNEYLAGPFFDMGGAWFAVAILILLLGHTVNFGLGMIGPGLHSLRLHYVEFFTKFFEGGGEQFVPVGRKRKLSLETPREA